jgi:hypothetical protein
MSNGDDSWDIPSSTGYSGGYVPADPNAVVGSQGFYSGLGTGPGQFNPETAPGWGMGPDPAFGGPQPIDAGTWDTGSSGSFMSRLGALGGAITDLTKGLGGTGAAGQTAARPMQLNMGSPMPPGSAGIGRPSSPQQLAMLLQMLMQRRNAYIAAANPRAATPVTQGMPSGSGGLLGL